jgi:hypothetical protein
MAYPQAPTMISSQTAITGVIHSPAHLHFYDMNGNHVGVTDTDTIDRNIPNSFYFSHKEVHIDAGEVSPEKIIVIEPQGSFTYQVIGTEEGTYRLELSNLESGGETIFGAIDIPTIPGAVHKYEIDWNALSSDEQGVTVEVDADADGIFEKTITSDNVLTKSEFLNDLDGDGIPDDEDACPNSNLTETVTIDGCESGAENAIFDDGCTISDLIRECAEEAKNHGKFVRCVAHLSNELKKDGLITGKEKGAIQSCAAQSDIP